MNAPIELSGQATADEASLKQKLGARTTGAHAAHSTEKSGATNIYYFIFILFIVNVVNYIDRMAFAVLAPSIKDDMGLSDVQLGLLVGFAFSLFYAVCGIPIARWADRGSRRNIVALALMTWSIMTVLSGAAQNFWQLFLARVGLGAGEAGCLPPSQSMICDRVPLAQRPAIFAFHTFGLLVGMMLGMALAGWLGESIGWRWTLVALGSPGVALAVLVRFTLREPSRGAYDSVESESVNLTFGSTLEVLWRIPLYRVLVCFLVVNGFFSYGLMQWWPSFFMRAFDVNLSALGFYLGVAQVSGSGAGLLIGGLLASRVLLHNPKLPFVIGAVASLVSVPTALGTLFASSVMVSMIFVVLTGFLGALASAPVFAVLYSCVPPQVRATAGAIGIFLTAIFGQGLGPFGIGLLSDVLSPSLGSEALRYALLAPVCLLPVMAISLYAAGRISGNRGTEYLGRS